MGCDLCGRDVELKEVLVEGSVLSVCCGCSRFGKIIEMADKKISSKPKKSFQFVDEDIEIINKDYDEIVKKARESHGLKQEELANKISEKVSLIHQVESKQITPSIKLAKKLEKFLGIKLIEKYIEPEIDKPKIDFGNKKLTIGDLIKSKIK